MRRIIIAALFALLPLAAHAQGISNPCQFGTTTGTCIQGAGALGTPSSGNGSNLTNLPGANITAGSIANAALANPATTVNGKTCTLGSSCHQDIFMAYLAASTSANVTGDGTVYLVAFDTTSINTGSDFSTSTHLWTAPAAGTIILTFNAPLTPILVTNTGITAYVNSSVAGQYQIVGTGGAVISTVYGSNQFNVQGSATIHVASGETLGIEVVVFGQTKSVSVVGGVTNASFGGTFIPD